MDVMCSYGLPLFSLEDNSTLELIHRLRSFRKSYEPYHGYLCTAICSFGILTNLINVVVLTKRQMRTSINILLTGIAFCDMGTMASYLIYILHFVLAEHLCNPFLYTFGWMCFLMGHVMVSIALHTTTLWLSVAMAFIRNMTLRHARVGSPWLRSNNTWKICVITYVCVFILSVPSVFSNGIIPWPQYFNQTCRDSDMIHGYKAYTIGVPPENCLVFTITFWLTGTLFKIIPCVLLALLIISLLCTIKRAEKNRKALFDVNRNRAIMNVATTTLFPNPKRQNSDSSRSGSTADRTTAMLLMILGLSLLTELPQGAISILSGIYVAHMQEYVYPNLADLLDLLSLINSSVNFILYCIMSSKYRQAFWQVVLPRKLYVHWFIRPRQSARCRSMSRRRRLMPPAITNDSRPRLTASRRFQRAGPNEEILEEVGADIKTNDMYTQPFTFTGTMKPITDLDPTTPPPTYLQSLLLPRWSTRRTRTSDTSMTSLPSTSRLSAYSAGVEKRSGGKLSIFSGRSPSTSSQPFTPTSCQSEKKDKGLFSFWNFQRDESNKKDGSKSERSLCSIGCSCLCKCAFRSDIESSRIEEGDGEKSNIVTVTKEHSPVEEYGLDRNVEKEDVKKHQQTPVLKLEGQNLFL